MYDLVYELIGHTWSGSGYSGTEEQYIYSICGVIIIIVLVVLVRWIDKIFMR